MTALGLINPTAMEAGLAAAAKARGLEASRAAAFEAFAATGLPHRRMEAWKWTDLRQALREDLTALAADNDVIAPSVFASAGVYEITVMNGAAEWEGEAPAGVALSLAAPDAPQTDHPLAHLAAAFSEKVLTIEIAPGAAVERSLLIRHIAGPGAAQARLALTLGAGAAATVIESFDGAGAYFSNGYGEITLGEDASLTRLVLQDGSAEGVETNVWSARLAARAAFRQTALLLGAKAARLETAIACEGEETAVHLDSAAVLSGARHADLTTLLDHSALGGASRQVHKSVLKDRARGVFQGKFHVARRAQKTDAQMKAQALLLSDTAEANHKPELEIYADDVQCAHGSTAGALDEAALFYMRQRGLDEEAARALLIEAFVGETFDAIAHPALREILHRRLLHWLGRRA